MIAAQRHLFVWIDGTTPFSIERSLSYGPPVGVDDSDDDDSEGPAPAA